MKLALTKRGTYALRAAVYLAGHPFELCKRRTIAAAAGSPLPTLTETLVRLREAGLVEAAGGPSGGYRLSRSPAEITVLEVIEAAERELATRVCVLRGVPCDGSCSFHWLWRSAQEALIARLAGTTLEDVVRSG